MRARAGLAAAVRPSWWPAARWRLHQPGRTCARRSSPSCSAVLPRRLRAIRSQRCWRSSAVRADADRQGDLLRARDGRRMIRDACSASASGSGCQQQGDHIVADRLRASRSRIAGAAAREPGTVPLTVAARTCARCRVASCCGAARARGYSAESTSRAARRAGELGGRATRRFSDNWPSTAAGGWRCADAVRSYTISCARASSSDGRAPRDLTSDRRASAM